MELDFVFVEIIPCSEGIALLVLDSIYRDLLLFNNKFKILKSYNC